MQHSKLAYAAIGCDYSRICDKGSASILAINESL